MVTLKDILESDTRLFIILANWKLVKIRMNSTNTPAPYRLFPFRNEGSFWMGPRLNQAKIMSQQSRTEFISRSPSDALISLAANTKGSKRSNCLNEKMEGN